MNNYNFSFFTKGSIWLTKHIPIKSHSLSSFILFGLPFYILFLIMIIIKGKLMIYQPIIFISMIIAGTWLFLGPVLIVNWELSYKKFQEDLRQNIESSDKIKSTVINKIYSNDKFRYIMSVSFSIIICGVVFSGVEVYKKLGLNQGYGDPIFWLSVFLALQIGFTVGFGFWGVFKTIHSIIILKKYHVLCWSVFSSDKHGGLSFLYKFILSTTFGFSAGSVMVPVWLQITISSNSYVNAVSYFLICLYSVSIASSFFVPANSISKIIKQKIKGKLDEISKSLNAKINHEDDPQEYLMLLETFKYLDKYRLVPLLDIFKVIKFSISFLAPILLVILDTIVKKHY